MPLELIEWEGVSGRGIESRTGIKQSAPSAGENHLYVID